LNGPGGFFDFWDRLADILRRDIYTPANKATVDDEDDVGAYFWEWYLSLYKLRISKAYKHAPPLTRREIRLIRKFLER